MHPDDREQLEEIQREMGLYPEDDEINDQAQKKEYGYAQENWDWQKIMEMPNYIKTKSGRKIRNFKKEQLMRDFNK